MSPSPTLKNRPRLCTAGGATPLPHPVRAAAGAGRRFPALLPLAGSAAEGEKAYGLRVHSTADPSLPDTSRALRHPAAQPRSNTSLTRAGRAALVAQLDGGQCLALRASACAREEPLQDVRRSILSAQRDSQARAAGERRRTLRGRPRGLRHHNRQSMPPSHVRQGHAHDSAQQVRFRGSPCRTRGCGSDRATNSAPSRPGPALARAPALRRAGTAGAPGGAWRRRRGRERRAARGRPSRRPSGSQRARSQSAAGGGTT